MLYDLIVRGIAVLPEGPIENAWIAVFGGKIAAIGTGEAPQAAESFDAGSDLIIPGVIDGQTHACSYGGLPGIRSTTRSAISRSAGWGGSRTAIPPARPMPSR